jgi:hypothetical protein
MSIRLVCVVAVFALLAAGCGGAAKAARTTPENPPLDMPAPPTRDVEPNDVTAPPPVPLPQEPARSAPPRPRPAPPPANQPRADVPRTEPPKVTDTPVEPPRPPAEEMPRPPTVLQTAPASEESEIERAIRATLTRANGDLNRVDYRSLNPDARAQYDNAKSLIRQGDEAVRAKNMVYAKTCADKAALIAAQLARR